MRLIDADEFKEIIVTYGKAGFAALRINKICELIDSQTTAYDVDKVVEQINDLVKPTAQYRHNFCGTVTDEHCVKYDGCESCMAEQICKVVKSGGIE